MAGVMAEWVVADSPAMRAGIQPGDVITRLANDEGTKHRSVCPKMTSMAPDTTVEIAVLRDGHTHILRVTLGTRPVTAP
jgi:S1-C subfamily serine protease